MISFATQEDDEVGELEAATLELLGATTFYMFKQIQMDRNQFDSRQERQSARLDASQACQPASQHNRTHPLVALVVLVGLYLRGQACFCFRFMA